MTWCVRTIAALAIAMVCVALQMTAARAQEASSGGRQDGPRVAVLSPALASILRDLRLDRLMVARHAFDIWSDQTLPVVGDQAGIDYEALIRARPTHVLIEWGSRPLPARLTELAGVRGWDVRNFSTLSLDDIRETTRRLNDLDPAGPAWESHPLRAAMERAWAPRRRDEPGPSVLILIAASPTAAALGPGSSHHEILKLAGGRPALAEGGPYQELDAEDVLRLSPGAIVLIEPRAAGGAGGAAVGEGERSPADLPAERRRVALGALADLDIPAVRDGKVAVIDDPLTLLPGTSLVLFADRVSALLDRWTGVAARAAEPGPGGGDR